MQIKLYKPTEPQKDFNRLTNVDQPFISCLVAGRQTGKTFFMQNDCVMRALNNPKHRMFWVSPIQDQANKVMKDIEGMIQNHKDQIEKKDKEIKKLKENLTESRVKNSNLQQEIEELSE